MRARRSVWLLTALGAALGGSLHAQGASMAMGPMLMGPMPAAYAGEADKPGAPVFKGLSDHKHPISTGNAKTQMFFDQGVDLVFGFNHAEAIRSFREAARLDPDCAMCWWGVAFALGPNINMPMPDDAVAPAWAALQKSQALKSKAGPEERAWIDALATRYAPPDRRADRRALDAAFAKAMGELWKAWPDDLDAGTFYAEAMMDTQPWDYWEPDGKTPKGHAPEIVSTLERVIARDPNHPGALHLYIHAVEATTTPERAEAAADRLEQLMPGAGHIVHMPSHIYYRVGRYADARKVNELAATADEDYLAACRAQGFYPAAYYGHNIHFLWTSNEMEGRYRASIAAARRLVKAVDAVNVAAQLPLAEIYAFTPVVTELRFEKWDAVLAEPSPPKALVVDRAIDLYAKGTAYAAKGELAKAQDERDLLSAVIAVGDFSRYTDFMMPAKAMATMGLDLLDGEIARAKGDTAGAVTHFRAAYQIQLSMPYNEPPWWHQPVSHVLGAALLADHRPAEAEAVYRESLKVYRDDGWALFGLAQALDAQGRRDEAGAARQKFIAVWGDADIALASSRSPS